MTKLYHTQNSIYEVDGEMTGPGRVRRLEGTGTPTAYMGAGEWREYVAYARVSSNGEQFLVFAWPNDPAKPGVLQTTWTSPLRMDANATDHS